MRQRVARVHLRQLILVSRGDVDADAGGVVGPSLDPADVRGTSGGRRLTIQRRPTLRQGVEPIQSSSPWFLEVLYHSSRWVGAVVDLYVKEWNIYSPVLPDSSTFCTTIVAE